MSNPETVSGDIRPTVAPLNFANLNVGDQLQSLEFGPVSRHTLALFCGGSGDHNPIHVDTDFAKAAGYEDVFVHGMFSMAILGRMLTNWTAQKNIKSFSVRFAAITQVLDEVTASARILEKISEGDEQRLILDIQTTTQADIVCLKGHAEIDVPRL